jgi:hypothetical protein
MIRVQIVGGVGLLAGEINYIFLKDKFITQNTIIYYHKQFLNEIKLLKVY